MNRLVSAQVLKGVFWPRCRKLPKKLCRESHSLPGDKPVFMLGWIWDSRGVLPRSFQKFFQKKVFALPVFWKSYSLCSALATGPLRGAPIMSPPIGSFQKLCLFCERSGTTARSGWSRSHLVGAPIMRVPMGSGHKR